jgi:glycine dehydrogenase subunit 2
MTEPSIFELSSPGRQGVRFPASDVPEVELPPLSAEKNCPSLNWRKLT